PPGLPHGAPRSIGPATTSQPSRSTRAGAGSFYGERLPNRVPERFAVRVSGVLPACSLLSLGAKRSTPAVEITRRGSAVVGDAGQWFVLATSFGVSGMLLRPWAPT